MEVVQSPDMIIPCSLFSMSVSPTECCSLENFIGPWGTITTDTQTFKEKTKETFYEARWMLTMT
jgi:hypothetical protein